MDGFIFPILTMLVSLGALVWAAHYTIKSVGNLIEITGVSEASAGFVFLALVSSLPEVTVAVFSILDGVPGVSVGDIMGSHVFNIGFVIGILAVLGAFKKLEKDPLVELLDILFLASALPILLVIFGASSRIVGIILLGIFVFSIYDMTRKRKSSSSNPRRVEEKGNKLKTVCFIVLSAAITIVASRFVVSSGSEIIKSIGILPIVLGAKIIAVGTSIPELMFGLAANKAKRPNLALGDVIGANLTTVTLVLGIVLIASPFAVDITRFTEIILFVIVSNLILWRYLVKGRISQLGGIILVFMYILFQAILE